MTPPLTDAQVAALADPDNGIEYHDGFGGQFNDNEPDLDPWTATHALALEVQQSRQRRCGNCRFFEPWRKGGETGCCDRTPSPVTAGISATWSCADFTPKAPTTEGVTP